MKNFLLIFSTVCFLLIPFQSQAQVPFGGKIAWVQPCFNGNFLINILPVAGSPQMVYQPGVSRLYDYGQILTVGVNVLGLTTVPVPCLIWPFPPVIITAPMIFMVGTSLTP